jgi:hypothetical protein
MEDVEGMSPDRLHRAAVEYTEDKEAIWEKMVGRTLYFVSEWGI